VPIMPPKIFCYNIGASLPCPALRYTRPVTAVLSLRCSGYVVLSKYKYERLAWWSRVRRRRRCHRTAWQREREKARAR